MSRHYELPALLIEFEQDKSFALQAPEDIGKDISPYNIVSKLCLLFLHHPKLRCFWSRSLHATAELFLDLKANHEEPDAHAAAAVGVPISADADDRAGAVNEGAVELLRRLPGVTNRNYHALMSACTCLADLVDMSEARLKELMKDEPRNAEVLFKFLHAEYPKQQQ